MGLTSALNTSLNGLALNETKIDVLGNNIANAGTNGFKASEVLFATQLSRTLSVGSRPSDTNGGTNPRQIGLGATNTAIRRDFTQGSVTTSTSPSDLAIQGDGFFILDAPDGSAYTRAGNFSLNSENFLVNAQGFRVQGYGVNEDFDIVNTSLTDIRIPLGSLNIAQASSTMLIGGALLSTGEVATHGAQLLSEALTDSSTAAAITSASLLSNVQDSGGTNLFTVGETLEFTPEEGGRTLAPKTLDVTAATTVADLMTYFDNTIGLHSGGGVPNDGNTGGQPGVTVNASGQILIVGNMGSVNDLAINLGDLTSNTAPVDLSFTKTTTANGEGALADLVAFDSLGEQVNITVSTVLESRDSTTTTFRYFVESADDSDPDVVVASGTIVFDSNGDIVDNGVNSSTAMISVDRDNSAALSPQQIVLDFNNVSGISTASSGSSLTLQTQDGSPPGTLSSFVIDEGGVINGIFDNGIIRSLGQVTLARFANPQGLLEGGDTTFREGVGSGTPFLVAPGTFGAGTIRSGAIELSNTDIGKNLVDLIVASTNYRGNARVISSVQELVDELLVLGR